MQNKFYLRNYIFFMFLVFIVSGISPAQAYTYNAIRCSMVNDPIFTKLSKEEAVEIIKSSGCASPSFCTFEQLFNDITVGGDVVDWHYGVFMDKSGLSVVEFVGRLNFSTVVQDVNFDLPAFLGDFQRYDETIFVLRFAKNGAHFKCVQQLIVPFETSGAIYNFSNNDVEDDFKQIRNAYYKMSVAFRVGAFAFGSDRVGEQHCLQVVPVSSAITKFGKFVNVGGRVGVERDEFSKGKLVKSFYFTNGDYIKIH